MGREAIPISRIAAVQLSRSLRALKVWMSVQTFGLGAFRRAVLKGMELADRAEAYIRESPTLEILTPVSLGIVCFRVNPTDTALDEESPGRDQQKCARPCLLGRSCAHVINARRENVFAQAVHTQPHHDLERCA